MALTSRQQRFVEEYLLDLNATQAAIRAGYSASVANREGTRLLSNAVIAEAVTAAQAERSARTAITQDLVLRRWWEISQADPNDLIQYRRQCCRHCYGEAHRYQFTAAEFADNETTARKGKGADFIVDPKGGLGFDARRDPHPDCPECFGEGTGRLHALDTRKLKGRARLLYKGARRTKDGLEIMLHDQAKALENVARHLGMFSERKEESEDTAAESARKIREATAAMDQTEGRDG